jgi:hypothetical protein
VQYLLKAADIYYGLSPKEVRKLAYQYATELKIDPVPEGWSKNKQAGADWFLPLVLVLFNFIFHSLGLTIKNILLRGVGLPVG